MCQSSLANDERIAYKAIVCEGVSSASDKCGSDQCGGDEAVDS